jgi:hypothetical protein
MKLKLIFNKHYWFDLYYKVKCFFKPKQEWLTDVIPDTYCDKVELIPRLLFKCLEHHVEVERKVKWVHDIGYDWAQEVYLNFVSQAYADEQMKIDKELMKAYTWIKTDRNEIDEQINAAYPPSEPLETLFTESRSEDGHYKLTVSPERSACYKEVCRLEAIKLKKDKDCMRTIIKHHHRLWT